MFRWIALLLKAAALGVVIALAWVALHIDTLHAMAAAQEERNDYRARLEAVTREVALLKAERDALARAQFSAEKRLRERFLLARPDERVILLEPAEPPDTSRRRRASLMADPAPADSDDEAPGPAVESPEQRRARLYGAGGAAASR